MVGSDYGSGEQGGGGGGKSASSSASSASAINFGGGLVTEQGGLTPLAGVILGAVGLLAFVTLVVVAKR